MTTAYIRSLDQAAQPLRSQSQSRRDRVLEWYRSLPAVSRDRRFSMSEIETALSTQGRLISPVLLELGWRRKRVWSTIGQYHRYWEPPTNLDEHTTLSGPVSDRKKAPCSTNLAVRN